VADIVYKCFLAASTESVRYLRLAVFELLHSHSVFSTTTPRMLPHTRSRGCEGAWKAAGNTLGRKSLSSLHVAFYTVISGWLSCIPCTMTYVCTHGITRDLGTICSCWVFMVSKEHTLPEVPTHPIKNQSQWKLDLTWCDVGRPDMKLMWKIWWDLSCILHLPFLAALVCWLECNILSDS